MNYDVSVLPTLHLCQNGGSGGRGDTLIQLVPSFRGRGDTLIQLVPSFRGRGDTLIQLVPSFRGIRVVTMLRA
jgi:hypothetical protein